MLKVLLSCLFVLCLVQTGFGLNYVFGNCPPVKAKRSFDPTKFLGIWYATEGTASIQKCTKLNITSHKDKKYSFGITHSFQQPYLKFVGHYYENEGNLTIPKHSVPGYMKAKFHWSIVPWQMTIFDTDYNNYAGLFICQQLLYVTKQSFLILSRNKVLDPILTEKVKGELELFNFNPKELSPIKQDNECHRKDDDDVYNIVLEKDFLTPKASGKFVNKLFKKTFGSGEESGEKSEEGKEESSSSRKGLFHLGDDK